MTKKRLTYKDLLQQRREKLFMGREEERQVFRRNFGCEVPEQLIFAVHGQAGIGKSFRLDEEYRQMARGEEVFDGIREDEGFKALVGENG